MGNITVPFAISKTSNKIIYPLDILNKSLEDRRLDEYICSYCNGTVFSNVNQKNTNNQSWFRHQKGCICKLSDYSDREKELDKIHVKSKESKEHLSLKFALRKWLYNHGAEKVEEEKIIFNDSLFYRKPDVYCEYQGHKLAFEIQISKLSYKSLKIRSKFFKDNSIYCIWIANRFIPNKTQSDIDFVTHNPKENVFTATLINNNFQLLVNYIEPSSKKINNWKTTNLNQLNKLKFDNTSFQVYYYDTPLFREKIERENTIKLITEEDTKRRLILCKQKKENQLSLANKYIKSIDYMNFSDWQDDISFALELEFDYENFLPEIQNYFFKKIKDISECSKRDYAKPFINNLIYHQYGYIVKFLLDKSPYNLYVDGKDECNISIWGQLIGQSYGFTGNGFIDWQELVPLVNKHTKGKQYSLTDMNNLIEINCH